MENFICLWTFSVTAKQHYKWLQIQYTMKDSMAVNSIHHEGTKHIEIDYYLVREKILQGLMKIDYVSTQYQPSNVTFSSFLFSMFIYYKC